MRYRDRCSFVIIGGETINKVDHGFGYGNQADQTLDYDFSIYSQMITFYTV